MNESEAYRAVQDGLRARARWGHASEGGAARAEGRVVAYSPRPMVLIVTDEGERVWWTADLADLTTEPPKPNHCSCGNAFDDDNFCMISACQWEDVERPLPPAKDASQ